MTTLVLSKWGHSYGIRIPQILLKQLQMQPGDTLEIEPDLVGQQLILKASSKRKGWLEAFNKEGIGIERDEPLMDFNNQFDEDEWTW